MSLSWASEYIFGTLTWAIVDHWALYFLETFEGKKGYLSIPFLLKGVQTETLFTPIQFILNFRLRLWYVHGPRSSNENP